MSRPAPRPGRITTALLLLLLGSAAPAAGQWTVDLSAGSAAYPALASEVGSRSAMLGVYHPGERWLYLSAGVPLDTAGLPWGAAGLGGRLQARRAPVTLGVDLSGQAHGYRAPALDATGAGVVLEALPFVAWSTGVTEVEGRAGVQHYSRTFDGAAASRSLLETGARVTTRPAPAVRLGAEGRYLRASEGGYPFLGASLRLGLGRGRLSARAGRWLAEALDEPSWSLIGELSVDDRTDLYAGVEREAPDPLYWNDLRRSWTVGVTRTLGRAAPAAPAAVPVTPLSTAGAVEIRIPLSAAAEPPRIAGDFNGWSTVPMQRVGDGWSVSLRLEPGVYRYAFQRADGSWFVPASVPNRVDDGFGGENAVLVVAAPGSE